MNASKALAAKIADELFTSRDGKRADRLVFELPSREPWGGWSHAAATHRIEKILQEGADSSFGGRPFSRNPRWP